MSATNKTTHYELPVFLGSDKPAWLVDWNGAMAAIDSAIYEAKTTADGAASSVTTVAADLATLSSTVSGQGSDISTLSGSLTSLIGTVNTITSLIGNGEPTTTDKTIIGAINEINAKIPEGGTAASGVTYDNTSSGLTADDVQEAIDELQTEIEGLAPTPSAGMVPIFIMDSYGNNVNAASKHVYELVDDVLGFSDYEKIVVDGGGAYNGLLTSAVTNYAGVTTPYNTAIIIAGANDQNAISQSHQADVRTAVTTLVEAVKTKFANVKDIIVMCPGMTFNNTFNMKTRPELADAYKRGAADGGARYIDNSQYILCNTKLLASDKVHPNAAGVDKLAEFTVDAILNGIVDVEYQFTTGATVTDQDTGSAFFSMYRHNGVVRVDSSGAQGFLVRHNDSQAYTGASVDLANITDTLAEMNETGGEGFASCYGVAKVSSTITPMKCAMYVSGGKLKGYIAEAFGAASTTATNLRVIGTITVLD